MTHTSKLAALCGAVGLALIAISGTAAADGYEVAAPAPPTRAASSPTPSTSASISDYVFRGISQNDNDPTMQGGIDLGYGILYAGVWASGINFDAIVNDADLEVDWYGGIKPTWGPATFDFGVIYYSYPGATYTTIPPFGFDLNYVELKAGVSGTIHKDLAVGGHHLLVARLLRPDRQRVDVRRQRCLHLPPGRRVHAESSPALSAIRRAPTTTTTPGTASASTGTTTRV